MPGTTAVRAGESTAENAAEAAVQAKRAHTVGWASEAFTARPALVAAMKTWIPRSRRRLSSASAREPPMREKTSRGRSWPEAEQPDHHRGVGQLVDLVGGGDDRELAPHERHRLTPEQKSELSGLPQRGGIDDQSAAE